MLPQLYKARRHAFPSTHLLQFRSPRSSSPARPPLLRSVRFVQEVRSVAVQLNLMADSLRFGSCSSELCLHSPVPV
ncbi:unnamed protein product [Urochloa humidicola]